MGLAEYSLNNSGQKHVVSGDMYWQMAQGYIDTAHVLNQEEDLDYIEGTRARIKNKYNKGAI